VATSDIFLAKIIDFSIPDFKVRAFNAEIAAAI
jgi:hypothetical protein